MRSTSCRQCCVAMGRRFNARDLVRMLVCVVEDVGFHLLRSSGLVRQAWGIVRQVGGLCHDYRIVRAETRDVGDRRVFASGSLSLAGEVDVGAFCAVHRIAGGVSVSAYHYLTGPDMIRQLRLIR